MRRAVYMMTFVSVLPLLMVGCGLNLFGSGVKFGGQRTLDVRIADDLNDNSPVAVELLVVYSPALDDELLKLDSRAWFAERQQYLKDFSEEDLVSFRWEWTPGQPVQASTFSYRSGARAVILFASYSSPGEHRVRFEPPSQNLRLHLQARDFVAEPY